MDSLFKSGFKHRLYHNELTLTDIATLSDPSLYRMVCLRLNIVHTDKTMADLINKFRIEQTRKLARAGIHYGTMTPASVVKLGPTLAQVVKWSKRVDLQYVNYMLEFTTVSAEEIADAVGAAMRRKSTLFLERLLTHAPAALPASSLKKCRWGPIEFLMQREPAFFTLDRWVGIAIGTFDAIVLRAALIAIRKVKPISNHLITRLLAIDAKYFKPYAKFPQQRIHVIMDLASMRCDASILHNCVMKILAAGHMPLLKHAETIAARMKQPLMYNMFMLAACGTSEVAEYVYVHLSSDDARTAFIKNTNVTSIPEEIRDWFLRKTLDIPGYNHTDTVERLHHSVDDRWTWYVHKFRYLVKLFV